MSRSVLAERAHAPDRLLPAPRRRLFGPVETLRELLRQGKLTRNGTQEFAGATAQRLTYAAGPQRVVFLVRRSGAPVGMITELTGGLDRTVVRFNERTSLPDTPESRNALTIAPHPGARIVRLTGVCR